MRRYVQFSPTEVKNKRKQCWLRDSISLHKLEGELVRTFHRCISHGAWSELKQCKCVSSVSYRCLPKAISATEIWGVTLETTDTVLNSESVQALGKHLNDLSRNHLHNRDIKHFSCSPIPTDICILINMNFIFKVWPFILANIHTAFEHYFLSSILNHHVPFLTWASLSVAVATVAMSTALLLVTLAASFMFLARKDGILFFPCDKY